MNQKDNEEKRIILLDKKLSRNISILMDKHAITESELAKALNLPYNTVKRLISGVTTDPRMSTILLIAEYFNISLDALLGNDDPTLLVNDNGNIPRSVPILSWDDAANKSIMENFDLNVFDSWQPIPLAPTKNLSKKAYALESRPSMQSRFPSGTFFVIDPEEKPIDGDLILMRFKSNDSISLRELLIDSPHWQFVSIMQNVPSINFDVKEHEIIGVVVLTVLQARKL